MKVRNQFPVHGGRPSARRHAERLARNAKHRKPEVYPRDTDRWIDRDGRFTVPNNKE